MKVVILRENGEVEERDLEELIKRKIIEQVVGGALPRILVMEGEKYVRYASLKNPKVTWYQKYKGHLIKVPKPISEKYGVKGRAIALLRAPFIALTIPLWVKIIAVLASLGIVSWIIGTTVQQTVTAVAEQFQAIMSLMMMMTVMMMMVSMISGMW